LASEGSEERSEAVAMGTGKACGADPSGVERSDGLERPAEAAQGMADYPLFDQPTEADETHDRAQAATGCQRFIGTKAAEQASFEVTREVREGGVAALRPTVERTEPARPGSARGWHLQVFDPAELTR